MTRHPAVLGLGAFVLAGCVTVVSPTRTPTPPSPPIARTATPTPAVTTRRYVVKSGDNLRALAQRFGLTVGQLLAANPTITDPNKIRVGQVLVIPPPDAPDTGPNSAGVSDATDDTVDIDGQLVASQSYADITGLGASLTTGQRIQVDLKLVNGPPARMDSAFEVVLYTVIIDVDGDGQPDYKLLYGNDLDGQTGYAASMEDRRTGQVESGALFPGTVSVGGRTITFLIRRTALGAPRAFALAASAERTYYPGGRGDREVDESVDRAPDQQWPRPNPRWVELGRA